ncbi:MAG: hypothetical protein KH230_04410 [Enterocloster asparagiformis]|nr:hypothetical protein [Enterocloster asparagiformis]
MKRRSWIITAAAVLAAALLAAGCAKKTSPETTPAATETTAQTTPAATEPETTEPATEADGEAVDLTNRYHMLQGTVVKTAEDGSVFTLQADDGKNYDIKLAQIRDVEVEIQEDVQIAVAYIGKEIGKDGVKPEDADLVVALPEQEEWTVYQETGTTVFNAMSSFTVKTDDNRELSLLKDNCPMEEGALTKDSGDRVMVAYVTSGGTNYPVEVRKGK